MPFNSLNLEGSFDLLARHASRKTDPWVQMAAPAEENAFTQMDAVLCLCRSDLSRSDIDPSFLCELKKGQVLLLLKNLYPGTVDLALKLGASNGTSFSWVKPGGELHNGVLKIALRPLVSKMFKKRPFLKPVIALHQPASEADGHSGVTVTARFVPDASIVQREIQSVCECGDVHEHHPMWEAEASF